MDDLDLHTLLDTAARTFEPVPDLARLDAAMATQRRVGRRVITWVGVAAGLAILAGSASALTGSGSADGVRPAGDGIEVTPAPDTTSSTEPSSAPSTTSATAHEDDQLPPDRVDEGIPVPVPDTATAPLDEAAPPELDVTTTVAAVLPPPTPAPPPSSQPAPPPAPTAPPTTEPPHTEPPSTSPGMAFSASQRWGSCDLDPPYDEFYGTAPAGSTVSVSSPYGSGSVTADGEGHWEITVYFPSAPVGVPFSVTVSASNGSATFTFTRT